MRLKSKTKNRLKTFMAMFLAFVCAVGAVPLNALADGPKAQDPVQAVEAEPFIARIYGEEVLVAADGIAMVSVEGLSEPVEMEIPRYIYIDGEAIPVNDGRIENITPVVTMPEPVTPFAAFSMSEAETEVSPIVGFVASVRGALPSNPVVSQIGDEYTHAAYVTMNGRSVSSIRYIVMINGVAYEAFCADRVTRS